MPVPYRKLPRAAQEGIAAFVEVQRSRTARQLVGALLLIDGRGQPLEFVHNVVDAPGGFLWPEEKVRAVGTVVLAHSLFDACQREPDLLVCRDTLGSVDFCREELAPSIPFAQVAEGEDDAPLAWSWINDPPASGMRAHALYEHLAKRGFVEEPFARLRDGLRIAYPEAFQAPARGGSTSANPSHSSHSSNPSATGRRIPTGERNS